MGSQKVLIVDFGTRHLNSLVSAVRNLVDPETIRMVRVTRQGIPLHPFKFSEIPTTTCESVFSADQVLKTDKTIIFSGSPDHVGDPAGFRTLSRQVLEESDIPMLGICYGHQLISTVWDKTIRMDFKGGQGNATFLPIISSAQDPVFKAVPMAGFLVAVRHSWSISKVPEGFVKLGETRTSYEIIAGIRHKTKPIYGLQFHPELPVPGFWFGEVIMRNFLGLSVPTIQTAEEVKF